jgi:excisionase family DNA binding protein
MPKTKNKPIAVAGPTSRFLTVKEAAELLRVSQVSIRRYLGQGRLRRFKVGARTLLQHDDVLALVRQAE